MVGCEDPLRDKISDLVKLHLNTSPNHALRDRDRVVARDLGLSTYPNTVCERDVVIELSGGSVLLTVRIAVSSPAELQQLQYVVAQRDVASLTAQLRSEPVAVLLGFSCSDVLSDGRMLACRGPQSLLRLLDYGSIFLGFDSSQVN